MPFTFAHPSILLPLKKLSPRYVSMSGLIMGSMLPDFEYFMRLVPYSTVSHTLVGVFYFDLPLGIVLLFIFHFFIRNRLIDNLPHSLFKRFADYKNFNWIKHFKENIFIVLLSLLIGIVSHIVWDSFTHESGFSVQLFPILSSDLPLIHLPVYKILQHGSTLLGFSFIACFILFLPKNKAVKQNRNKYYWLYLLTLFVILLCVFMAISTSLAIGRVVVIFISAGLLSITILSVIYKVLNDRI